MRTGLKAAIVGILAGMSLVLVPMRPAHATFVLELDDAATAGTEFSITDNGPGDSDSTVGLIHFSGATSNFSVNITTGISKPVIGNASRAELDLSSIEVSTSAGGTLTIRLSDTGFSLGGLTAVSFRSDIGGTLGSVGPNSLTFKSIYDPSDTLFGTGGGAITTDLGPFGPLGAFSGAAAKNITASAPFSLTQIVTLSLTGSQSVSFDAQIVVIPEPAALLLLGSGLVAVGFIGRKWRG
jgi:hypothetical protein